MMRDIWLLIYRWIGSALVLALSNLGLAQTPQLVKNFGGYYTAGLLVRVNEVLYFNYNGVAGNELWKSDGTSEGTVLVKDILPGPGHSGPQYLTDFNGILVFSAHDVTTGNELWKSDGTAAGTVLIKDINPFGDAVLGFLTVVQNTLFFCATDGITGYELWKTDGTAEGTALIKDIVPGPAFSVPGNLTNVNGTLFFAAVSQTNGSELWKSDGTTAGTVLVKDIRPGVFGSGPRFLFNCNGILFFLASDGTSGLELWKSDGTENGTVLVKDINPGPGDSFPGLVGGVHFTSIGSTVFFQADDGTNGLELWKSDGTAAGTMLVKDINPSSGSSAPDFMINVNGTLIFRADDGSNGRELWKSDGTAIGTVLIKDIRPGPIGAFGSFSLLPDIAEVNGTAFFSANDGVNGDELWKSDGTIAGTMLVQDFYPGTVGSAPRSLTNFNDVLFFYVNDRTTGTELWKLTMNQPPTVAAGGPYNVNEGASVTVIALGNDPENEPLTYAWDLDNDGSFETPGQSATFSAADIDGSASRTIQVQVADNGGLMATDQATVDVLNVSPTATFTVTPSTIVVGQSATLAFSNQFDPSAADVAAGFKYSYDGTNDGTFEISDVTTMSYTYSYPTSGTFTAKGRIKDKDGGFNDYTVQIVVQTPQDATGSLIDQINALVASGDLEANQAKPLTDKLTAIIGLLDNHKTEVAINQLETFINMVNADINSGTLTPEQGQSLIDAANAIIAALTNPQLAKAGFQPNASEGLAAVDPTIGSLPTGFQLEQNSPNPFNSMTRISFALPEPGEVSLVIYSIQGQLVRRLIGGVMNAGYHSIIWNARDEGGHQVTSGVYVYVIKAGNFIAQKKLLFVK